MYIDLRWLIVIVLASAVYGSLSLVIAARRLHFLASTLPHTALLSVVFAIIVSSIFGGSPEVWAVSASVVLVYLVALMISKGIEPDIATAIFVSLSVSLTVIGMYYVLTRFPTETSLWAYILGDPLLVTWRDVHYMTIISLIVLLMVVPFLREHVLIGVDRDFVKLSGTKVAMYDAMLMASLALATVGLLRSVGFVIEHVMLLLPGSIAAMIAKSGRNAVVVGLFVSFFGSIVGLLMSLIIGLAPSGLIGLVLLTIYIIGLFLRR